MDTELDKLINKYTDDLIKLKEQWSQWGIATEKESESLPVLLTETTKATSENQNNEDSDFNDSSTLQDTAVDPEEYEKSNISADLEIPLANPENFALFSARVFTGNQAYPVSNAKVSVYLDGKLHIFLTTDENGETRTVKLESFPETNSFIPESTQQTLNYKADIQADGFIERRGLLVSAVGGSDILLSTELTPISERID